MDGTCKEDHFETEISDSSLCQARGTIHSGVLLPLHLIVVNVGGLMLFAWFHQLYNVRYYDQCAGEDTLVSRFGFIDSISAKDYID